ncbi:UNVERIFIED_CONTAM: hypothetical protein Sradi_7184300 [Sesamum radiatum]|uniref:DUF4283 domain-containing protein n=1 Tax=Sesamum radiatum TaxID=300843 RepID=A0AAW2IUF5_SESRA
MRLGGLHCWWLGLGRAWLGSGWRGLGRGWLGRVVHGWARLVHGPDGVGWARLLVAVSGWGSWLGLEPRWGRRPDRWLVGSGGLGRWSLAGLEGRCGLIGLHLSKIPASSPRIAGSHLYHQIPLVEENISPQSIRNFVNICGWAFEISAAHFRRRFAAVGTNGGRGLVRLNSSPHCESNETNLSNFHQSLPEIEKFNFLRRRRLSVGFASPSDGGLLPEHHCRNRLVKTHKHLGLFSATSRPMVMAPFVYNSAEFPPLNSAELTRSATEQIQQKSFSAAAAPTSEKSIPSDSENFFFAGSNPTSIGTFNIINGRPTITFSDEETQSLSSGFRYALVGKFSQGSPSYSQMHRLLTELGLVGKFTVSMINSKHFLINLKNESDYSRLWLRRIWYLKGFPMRVFKWSPTFTPTQESSIVPVWVSLPELPAHLIRKDVMFVIANIIGTPLQIDSSKLSKARVCVEIDLLKPMLQEVDLQICGETIVQKVEYEQVPLYARYANMWGTKAPNVIRKDKNYVQADVNVTGIDIGILETENNLHDDAPHEIVVHTGGAENFMQVTDSDIVINYADEDSCGIHGGEVYDTCENDNFFVENETFNGDIKHALVENEEHIIDENVIAKNDFDKNGVVSFGALILRPDKFVCDLMKRSLWMKVDYVLRISETLKQFGVVMKGIEQDVEKVIKRNQLAEMAAGEEWACDWAEGGSEMGGRSCWAARVGAGPRARSLGARALAERERRSGLRCLGWAVTFKVGWALAGLSLETGR